MKPVKVGEGIIPLGEFKTRASTILKELKDEEGPLIITQHGRPAAVLLAPDAYDRMQERQSYLEAVAAGLSDAVAGRVVDHTKIAEWLASWGTDKESEPPL